MGKVLFTFFVFAILFLAFFGMIALAFRGLWRSWFPEDNQDPEYLEHYTTDGRLREEAFPSPEDFQSDKNS